MKAYNEAKCPFGILTLDEFGVIQGQGQKCQILLFKP